MQLCNFDTETFLAQYWQKKPLLIRQAWPDWVNPLDGDELAGLACEEGVEARLIQHQSEAVQMEQGPFAEDRFGQIGAMPWTLLVQAVDHHIPEVAALIDPFRFIPNWRIDDVMVSYANDGGGVGPHFDQYDVFLVQGLGQRRWQIGGMCDETTPLQSHDDLRLLADFVPLDEWVLEPGDVLYVPPGIAHNGVAVGGDCMTYSVGFRAPSRSELIGDWVDDFLADLPDDDRYRDELGNPAMRIPANPGEISAGALAALQAMITQKLADRDGFARWFGGYNSTPKNPDMEWQPDEPLQQADLQGFIARKVPLCRNPASRFSFIERETGGVLLFVDGQCYECAGQAAGFARNICAQTRIVLGGGAADEQAASQLIAALYNQGSVAFEMEE